MKLANLKLWLRAARRFTIVAVGLAVLVMTIAWLTGMFVSKVPPGHVASDELRFSGEPTDEVHEVNKATIEEAVGTLKASSRTILSAKLLATIESISVAAGDVVTPGQTLVLLDSREYRARLDQARQALDSAIASSLLAQSNYQRAETLLQQKAISRAEFDQANRDLQVASAEQSRAREAIAEAEVMLSYTTILAPKGGRIVDRLAEPGDVARPGEPLLVLYDATSLRLEAPVMEHLAVTLRTGDTLKVYIDALSREVTATIDEIVPQADAPSRTFLVKASLPQAEDLYEGMFGRLRMPSGERRHLCLNMDAVVRIGQLEFVDVVLPDGTIERRLIKTGQIGIPGRQEVLSGLAAGERVILRTGDHHVP
ncbi:MAG: efflux RND transporter periplasmic adaptor subunit [Pirellulaceae bacterium]|nr:efflux RND transporter periplasmic adaptor subunit [Pirellulaceae bacterium]